LDFQVMADSDDEAVERLREKYGDTDEIINMQDDDLLTAIAEREEREGTDEWLSRYTLVRNPNSTPDDLDPAASMFETYGTDYQEVLRVKATRPRRIWTLCEEDGIGWVQAGWHYVNRIGYFISNEEWIDDGEQYLYWD
jgi:hypothetical protein